MRIIVAVLVGWFVSLGIAHAQSEVGSAGAQAQAEGELVEGKTSFRETWVNPSADFTRYNKILPGGAEFEFRDVGPAKKYRSSMSSSSNKSGYGILESDQEKFEQVVNDAFVKELSRSK